MKKTPGLPYVFPKVLIKEERPLQASTRNHLEGIPRWCFHSGRLQLTKHSEPWKRRKANPCVPISSPFTGRCLLLKVTWKITAKSSFGIQWVNSTLQFFSAWKRLGKGSDIRMQEPCLAKAQWIFHPCYAWASQNPLKYLFCYKHFRIFWRHRRGGRYEEKPFEGQVQQSMPEKAQNSPFLEDDGTVTGRALDLESKAGFPSWLHIQNPASSSQHSSATDPGLGWWVWRPKQGLFKRFGSSSSSCRPWSRKGHAPWTWKCISNKTGIVVRHCVWDSEGFGDCTLAFPQVSACRGRL